MRKTTFKHLTHGMSTGRIEALNDGVYAIVMTLLVFEIKLPETVESQHLLSALFALWPRFLAYAISFVLLGIYWLGHRAQFYYIHRADPHLHWIHIFSLSCVSLLPFSTMLAGRFPLERLTLVIYGLNLIVIGLAQYWHWAYATRDNRMSDEKIPDAVIRLAKHRILLAPICYAFAIGFVFVSTPLSLILYAFVPLLYIVPGVLDHWMKLSGFLSEPAKDE